MPEIFPYNGDAPPNGCLMDRAKYDPNNDGIVDSSSSFVAAFARTNAAGKLELKNTDTGLWSTITVSGTAGNEVIDIGPQTS